MPTPASSRRSSTPSVFTWVISCWLWLTVISANLAEAVAEGRGKAQAEQAGAEPRGHPSRARPCAGSWQAA
ncbi:hypothetical protein [Streptomyces sp. CB03238]|uniref:hypothetical protein n=1 Tax=Streptomyces sp. CB03238 TaxID=1907777 RepID=UPI000A11FA3D|nr:hypothetical protein [Streptomyces sp. CB03238]ORT60719.1 hypothetical protein BKD26_05715 [Streptomyces sp. CB03238]